MTRNIVILGMHRSGTSMVAGALCRAGVYAGTPGELLEDQEDNPQGFWERRDVVELDDAILESLDSTWFRPPTGDRLDPQACLQRIESVLGRLPGDSSWLLKDPRMVLTWRAWDAALAARGDNPLLLYVYRDPRAVAVSLARRNHFPLQLGLALWEHYNRLALEALRGRDYLAVDFARIQADPAGELGKLLRQLDGFGVQLESLPEQGGFDPSLVRSSRQNASIHSAGQLMTPSQTALEGACRQLCEQGSLELPAADPGLQGRMSDLAAAMAPLADAYETRLALEEYTRLCDDRTRERDHSLQQLKSMEESYESLVGAHDKEVGLHKSLQRQHEDLQSQHSALAEAHHNEVSEHRQLATEYVELKEKAEYLFTALTHAYRSLLSFEQSHLAAINRNVGRAYKLLTRRRGVRTSYEDALADAREHFREFELELPEKPPGKLAHLRGVLKYMRENPAASARSFSLPRLKRGLSVMLRSSPEDFETWVNSRFPDRDAPGLDFDPGELDASLDTRELDFPRFETPRVSIVVPVYNDYRVTMNCLVALLENTPDIPYEVILADDCSTDLTASIGERVRNIVISRNETNQRFLLNCNAAAEHATGDYILFLNNDTAVCPGWLEPMVELLDSQEDVGIVGPKLIYADGRLQEAGGIIWRDASGWNFGRMDDPAKPEYNYVKEVDYISGACLLVRSELWRRLGGFDTRFVPAYYEDSDLAFAVRSLGYRVLYQPASQVYHFEGVSNGTDLASGQKQYQVVNQATFREKWAAELDAFHFDNAEHVSWARDRSRDRRTILVIDHYVPHYDKDAGSRSTFMYLQLMCEMGYRVMFMGANFFPHAPYTRTLQQMGVEVLVGESMARHLNRWLADNAPYIDAIYLHRPHVAEQFLAQLHKMNPRPPIVFFGHDLHYLRIQRELAITSDASLAQTAESWRKREYAVFDQVDRIYYPSEIEIEKIRAERPDLNLRAIPLYVLEDKQRPPHDPDSARDILFVGGFNHPPNVDAVCWFVAEVLPDIRAKCPDIRLHVVGSNPTAEVEALHCGEVVVHGYVSDEELDALYRGIAVAVVPLRYGAGVKGKVLEAVQQNVPLVTTAVGAEGIPDAEEVMTIADSARDFADRVGEVLAGDAATLAKLEHYPQWLARHFSKSRAAAMLAEDFGEPRRGQPKPAEAVAAAP
ncbi:glycosyltransferase [Parahaliea mediterranea]|uniref:Glycosyltransferase n=1 Tax=Parahaliea mediterranea TaxID=651086 RepID=A0A939DBT6_9GAMM|nr:glycosyltransferase [Parahaliea mediterranea]MBN7795175.1 glycosyltransferase [Parahaliea mediterranea]